MQGELRKIQAEFGDSVNPDFISLGNTGLASVCPEQGGLASWVSVLLH